MYDIITIGSASVDAFVKSKSEFRNHNTHTDLCYHLGEKILIENLIFTTGGGGTNTAVAFSRLGLKAAFIGIVGNDHNGDLILQELKREKVDFLGNIKPGTSGYSLILAGAKDRTILTYKGVNNSLSQRDVNLNLFKTRWLYVSTMLGKSFKTAYKLIKYSKRHNAKVALNLSPYLARKGLMKLSSLLKQADVLILNKEESALLTGKHNVREAIHEIARFAPAILVVTDGENPIYIYDREKIHTKSIRAVTPIDRTGTGDAFASGFIFGLIKNKGIETSLNYGYKEAVSVLRHIGAKNDLLRRL